MMKADDSPDAKKLTLRMSGDLIERAKRYAGERGISLSQMIAAYFRAITADAEAPEADWKQKLPPTTRSLVGIAGESGSREEDYYHHLIEKHR